jgi:thiamine-monophosphate kinase
MSSGEFEFINWIRGRTKAARGVIVGPGDDCAVVGLAEKKIALVTTDMMVEGVDFNLKTATPGHIGYKAMAISLSDIAAMGCEPRFAVAAVNLPRKRSMAFAKALYAGLRAAADPFGVAIVGGDVSSSRGELVVCTTVFGLEGTHKPVLRKGARPGDLILVTGELGGSILGKHLDFTPRVREGLALNEKYKPTSMIDISDGLLADLGHICDESRAGLEIYEWQIPVSADARKLSKRSGKTPLKHALSDGEDFELLFTLPRARALELVARQDIGTKVTVIGEVTRRKHVWMRNSSDRLRRIKITGYRHRFGAQ